MYFERTAKDSHVLVWRVSFAFDQRQQYNEAAAEAVHLIFKQEHDLL
jgi:hypothetical protein